MYHGGPCIDHECGHDTSVVTAHVDHVIGIGIFSAFQVPSLGQDVTICFLVPLGGL